MPEITRRTVRQDDRGGASGAAPLATLDPRNNKFLFSSLNYPIDIEQLSHAMLFNINVQDSSYDIPPTGIERIARDTVGVPRSARELVDDDVRGSRQQRTTAQISQFSLGLTKKTKRIKRAISLYVPETLVFEDRQDYETASLMDKYGIAGTAAISVASALGPRNTISGLGALAVAAAPMVAARGAEAVASRILTAAGIVGGVTGVLKTSAQMFGFALNPVIEVLYSGPQLRRFNFDFVFSPRNEAEADSVWNIIYEFRRHAAPEIFFKGTLLIPPSEFEITFLRKTSPTGQSRTIAGTGSTGGSFVENTNMPRISTCVLRSVQVDYASSGQFATFDDGMPIQIRMRLEFQETQQLTREAIDKGY